MKEIEVAMRLMELATASQKKPVFVHEMTGPRARWHYGDCFPDMDSCAIPSGADLDEEAHA